MAKDSKLQYDGIKEDEANKLPYLRKRAYINMGSTSSVDGKMPRALLQMAQEILSNSLDEALSGFGNEVDIIIHEDDTLTVKDHGRGLPKDLVELDKNGKEKVTPFGSAIKAFTRAGASGKFDNSAYGVGTGGLNGIGATATTALSEYVVVEAQTEKHEHYEFRVDYDTFIKNEEPTYTKDLPFDDSLGTFTNVTFKPDKRALDSIKWEVEGLANRYEMSSYLAPKTKITLIDEREHDEEDETKFWQKSWYSENGLVDYVKVMAEDSDIVSGLDKPITFSGEFPTKLGPGKEIYVHGALLWVENIGLNAVSFTNGIPTTEGGPHLDGALQAVTKSVNDYVTNRKLLPRNSVLDNSDIKDGLVLAIEVKIPEALLQFEGQTKEKLGTGEAKAATKEVVGKAVDKWLYDHEETATALIEKMKESKNVREKTIQARKDAKEARKAKSAGKQQLMVSSKLTRASSKDPAERELFIVEGDSASGSIRNARTANQAVFPLRGKILNVMDETLKRGLKNQEISTIASVLGAGIGPEFNPEELEYNKVIILTDADDDGMHIRSLLTVLFYRFFPGLIEDGHLFVAEAPLFKIRRYDKGKPVSEYAFDVATKDRIVEEWKSKGYKDIDISRFKGLGENDADELRDTVVMPGKRRLLRVTNNDDKASQKYLEINMGKSSEERRQWVMNHMIFDDEDVEI